MGAGLKHLFQRLCVIVLHIPKRVAERGDRLRGADVVVNGLFAVGCMPKMDAIILCRLLEVDEGDWSVGGPFCLAEA